MKIEIWSDVVCPFCYIGKRHFEKALESFSGKDGVEIQWKSFELDPHARPQPGISLNETLASKYGQSVEWAEQMQERVSATAAQAGLNFRLDQARPANTFNAHRLIHFAAGKGKQDLAEERFFKAYFEEGAVMDDPETLVRLAVEIGLDADEARNVLASDEFGMEVRYDEQEAQALGIRGVPFFVVDRKYGISGAQPVEVFQQTLEKAWAESRPLTMVNPGSNDATCTDDGCAV